MALQRDTRYPGRWTAASGGHPQGAFKNRTAPGSLDGSYIEQDWANDWDGFFSSLLSAAAITPNGAVDAVGASQYYNAFQALLNSKLPFRGTQIYSGAGSATWTVPAGVTRCLVYVTGGGGGGGGATSATGAAGGGGGGGLTGIKLCDLTGVTSVAVTVGAGGAGGIGNNTGVAGGSSSFGAFVAAGGGSGGVQSTGGSIISGSGSVTGSGADVNVPGGAGKFSLVVAGLVSSGGPGGDSFFSKGSGAPNISGTTPSQLTGNAGSQGAGGAGGAAYNATATGGAGGAGYVVIYY